MTARRFLPFLAAGVVVFLAVWNAAVFLEPRLPPWGGHFGTHLAFGLAGMLVGLGALRTRSARPSKPELAVITGAFLLAIGGLIEAQSAWIEYPSMGSLHLLSGVAGMLGMVVFALGLVALPVAAGRLPGWLIPLLVVVAALYLVVFVLGVGPLR